MKSPFKFLDAFTLADKDVFFGREDETEALYSTVFKTPLALIYGLSGTGKTSLVQCGLAGRFDGPDWYPFFLRRNDDINRSLADALAKAMPNGEKPRATLPDTVSLLFRYYLRPVYLIFDQFEELFILGSIEEQENFAKQIRSLIDAELPCKILLIMREEFIGQLYHIEKIIPMLYDHRLRVEPMGFKKVSSVITRSCQQFNIKLEKPDTNVQQIYDNISAGKSGIQLPYLQVYLDRMYREDYARTYSGKEEPGDALPPLTFTTAEIERFGRIEDVLGRFLSEQVVRLEKDVRAQEKSLPEEAVRKVLDVFVTEQGTKRPVGYRQVGEHVQLEEKVMALLTGFSEKAVDFICQRLAAARLLRLGEDNIELAHDSLAALIDSQRTEQERRANEVLNRLLTNHQEFKDTGEYLTRRQLNTLEEYLPILSYRLDEEVKQFIKNSQAAAESAEHAALLAEQRKRKQTARLAFFGFTLAALALAGALLAVRQTKVANRARRNLAKTAYYAQIKTAETLKLQGEYDAALLQLENAKPFVGEAGPEAQQQFDKLQETWPQAQLEVDAGDSLVAAGELHQAIARYEKARQLSSDTRIEDLIKRTEKDKAQQYKKFLDNGKAMMTARQYRRAAENFREALKRNPESEEARRLLEQARRGGGE